MRIPNESECIKLLKEHNVQDNVVKHCIVVSKIAKQVCDKLAKKGIRINKNIIITGALLHDICKGQKEHALKGYRLVKKLGYPEVAQLVRTHSLVIEATDKLPKTIEQKIVFYADKRVMHDKTVSVEERIKDLKKRYPISGDKELVYIKAIEKELGVED